MKLYDLEGFDTFPNYVTTIRATQYFFLDILHNFTLEQQKVLLGEVKRHSEAETTDNYICLLSWLKPDEVFVEHNYEGIKSAREWGVNISRKNMDALEKYRFEVTVEALTSEGLTACPANPA